MGRKGPESVEAAREQVMELELIQTKAKIANYGGTSITGQGAFSRIVMPT